MAEPVRISFARSLVTSGYVQTSAPQARINWDVRDAAIPYLLLSPVAPDDKTTATDADAFIF